MFSRTLLNIKQVKFSSNFGTSFYIVKALFKKQCVIITIKLRMEVHFINIKSYLEQRDFFTFKISFYRCSCSFLFIGWHVSFSVICLQLLSLINDCPKKFSTKHVKLYFLPIFNFKKSRHQKQKEFFLKIRKF